MTVPLWALLISGSQLNLANGDCSKAAIQRCKLGRVKLAACSSNNLASQ